MSAAIAITLFMELPRVAFEAQRDKEQLLIDRGEQYSRAVALYVRKFNRYPADFDALNNTQNQRFLRHKYVDPMTGKDDWRIIHVGPGGVFTDSKVYTNKKTDPNQQNAPQNFITELPPTGGYQTGTNPAGGVNIGTRQRQSDQPGAPGNITNPTQPGAPDGNANGQPGQPGQTEPVMVLPDGRVVPVSQGLAILNGTAGANGQLAGQQAPGRGGFPTANGQPNNANGQPFPNNNGANTGQFPPGMQTPVNFMPPGYQQANLAQAQNQLQGAAPTAQPQPFGASPQPGQPPANAASLINQLLTTPRPGGLNGIGVQQNAGSQQGTNPNAQAALNSFNGQQTTTGGFGAQPTTGTPAAALGTPAGGQTIGGGIAGVASKREQDAIKTYKDKTAYNEWEFVYDITKDPLRGGNQASPQQQAPVGTGAAPNQNGTQNNNNANPFSNSFGNNNSTTLTTGQGQGQQVQTLTPVQPGAPMQFPQ
jgi:hypothetical protein